jgi:hypothetical protein
MDDPPVKTGGSLPRTAVVHRTEDAVIVGFVRMRQPPRVEHDRAERSEPPILIGGDGGGDLLHIPFSRRGGGSGEWIAG